MKYNWSRYAGFQDFSKLADSDNFMVFYMNSFVNEESGTVNIAIMKGTVSCTLTEEEAWKTLMGLVETFPEKEIHTYTGFRRARDSVAKENHRGQPNVNVGNAWYYVGESSAFDSPFIVAMHGDKYGVFAQPNYKKYGFTVIER